MILPSFSILWIDSPVLSEQNCDSVPHRAKVFSLSQSLRPAAHWVWALHQSQAGALTGRKRSSATFDGLLSLWAGANKQQQYFRPSHTALATTFPRAGTLANKTEETDTITRINIQKSKFSSSLSSHLTAQRAAAVPGPCCSAVARERLTLTEANLPGSFLTGERRFQRVSPVAHPVLEQQPPR